MRGNGPRGKGKFVFIRTLNAENRNAIQSLYEGISKDLKRHKVKGVSAVLAHIYPQIGNGEQTIFGSISPDEVAQKVLEGVAKDRREIYAPEYMVYLTWWLKFMPAGITNLVDDFFFGDK